MSDMVNPSVQDPEARDAAAVLNTLRSIAEGQQQLIKAQQDNISAQRANIETTEKNTHAINELTVMFERERGEINTRFQKNEDRLDAVEHRQEQFEEGQRDTRKNIYGLVTTAMGAVLGACLSWFSQHWSFHFPSHGR